MRHIKKFNEANDPIVWVGALDDDYKYIPVSCELSIIYKGKDALPLLAKNINTKANETILNRIRNIYPNEKVEIF